MFPVFFVFLFFSSMAMPRDLIEQDWFRTVAAIAPLSYLIEEFARCTSSGSIGRRSASRSASPRS